MGGHIEVLIQPFEAVIILGRRRRRLRHRQHRTGAQADDRRVRHAAAWARATTRPHMSNCSACSSRCSSWCRRAASWRSSSTSKIPRTSPIFERFPKFAANHHAVEFLCDYMRMMTLGTNNVHELEALMDEELETHHQEGAAARYGHPVACRRHPGSRHRRRRARRDQDHGLDRRAARSARPHDRRRARGNIPRRVRRLRLLRPDGAGAAQHLRGRSQVLPRP